MTVSTTLEDLLKTVLPDQSELLFTIDSGSTYEMQKYIKNKLSISYATVRITKLSSARCFGIIVDHEDPSKIWFMVYHLNTGIKFSKVTMGSTIF